MNWKNIKKLLSQIFISKTFSISAVILIIYIIVFTNKILIDKNNIDYIFYFLLALLPLILSVFAILISFTDKEFLKFLKDNPEDSDVSIYDEIILYFKLNACLNVIGLMWVVFLIFSKYYDKIIVSKPIFQYVTIFIVIYIIISFIQVLFFIFKFAKTKGQFVDEK